MEANPTTAYTPLTTLRSRSQCVWPIPGTGTWTAGTRPATPSTPDENPGARVVTVLESGEAPWAIVTNGKLWRLYSARTHSRSTNYYEIDLDETLAMADPNESFRYFWLFFRLNAFVTREIQRDGQTRELSFLDRLLDESESYAKGLGERLKERVFEQVFPTLRHRLHRAPQGPSWTGGPSPDFVVAPFRSSFP